MTWLEHLAVDHNHILNVEALSDIATEEWPWYMSGLMLTQEAEAGSTVPLPAASGVRGNGPTEWVVYSGDATIDSDAGTIAYGSSGTVLLGWRNQIGRAGDSIGVRFSDCFAAGYFWSTRVADFDGDSWGSSQITDPTDEGACMKFDFGGNVTVNVTGTAPTSSHDAATVAPRGSSAETGGSTLHRDVSPFAWAAFLILAGAVFARTRRAARG
ncbi:MAG: hypothetical protein LBV00_03530 [Propionibacteriaceae bacterium]|jgi:hypothetical protein|nr:hypothetical protein [Propionibacteriaceae bacterium]